jgi:DNA-binding protein H-NS
LIEKNERLIRQTAVDIADEYLEKEAKEEEEEKKKERERERERERKGKGAID